MTYFDANYNHDEIGLFGGLYYHRSCAERRTDLEHHDWKPAEYFSLVPSAWNHCHMRGLEGYCVDSFKVVVEQPAPEHQHFI